MKKDIFLAFLEEKLHTKIEKWLGEAHRASENSFSTLCNGAFTEKFCGL